MEEEENNYGNSNDDEIDKEIKSRKTFRLISIDLEGILHLDCGSLFVDIDKNSSSDKNDDLKDINLNMNEKELIYDSEFNSNERQLNPNYE